jgi:uncharacterized membrane protein
MPGFLRSDFVALRYRPSIRKQSSGNWMISTQAFTAISAAFLASLVEVTEAYTIVLAVGLSRGWRAASAGTAAALISLGLMVAILGPFLNRVPLAALQFLIGLLLLVFGMGWLRKAILRAGGVIPLHDENAIFADEMAELQRNRVAPRGFDAAGALTAFQGVLLEGLEVVFIVTAVGAGPGLFVPASAGAALACVLVLLIGTAAQKPLSRVPENTLKFAVGLMLTSFGIFWIGEAIGVAWPGADFALVYIAGAFLISGLATTFYLRKSAA